MALLNRDRWEQASRQAWRLIVLSVAAGLVLWALRPDRLPILADPDVYALDLPVPLISLQEARALYEEGRHLFVDTRPGDPDRRAAIPGSFAIAAATFADDLAAVMDFIYPEDLLILYGEATPLPVATVAVRFLERGYTDVRILQGGLRAWRQAGGPLSGEDRDE
jgi:rhodanese-related sulfurtransferase